ncbi:MAG: hypothetical protein IT445_12175 [Phycisphaeraceae bacterium]|nr:hypothetical protein [Phycisphaeraceae bacterium]
MHIRVIVTETGGAVEVERVISGPGPRKAAVVQHTREQLRQIIRQVLKDHPDATCDIDEAVRRGYWWVDLGNEQFTVMVLEPQHIEQVSPAVVEVFVEGGVISNVKVPVGIKVLVRDYDIDGAERDRLQKDKDGRECAVSTWEGGSP